MLVTRLSCFGPILAGTLFSACANERDAKVPTPVNTSLHVEWSRSFQVEPLVADFDDAVFAGGQVVLVESATASILALDATDGKEKWRVGRRGAGPGEYLAPTFAFQLPDTTVGIVDSRQSRITVLNQDGSTRLMLTGEKVSGDLNNICTESDGSLLAIRMPFFDVVKIDNSPVAKDLFRVRWPLAIYNQTPMLQQGLFARSRNGRCVLFQPRGDYFQEIVNDAWSDSRFHRYVTPYPSQTLDVSGRIPRAIPGGGAAQYAVVAGDTLFVLRGGPTEADRGLVDGYQLESGQRASTFRLPKNTYIFDIHGSKVIALVSEESGSVLTLYTRR
jgi:hypothetical protein